VDTLNAAQNRGSNQDVNTNPKINWTFKEEDLTKTRRSGRCKKAPEVKRGTLLPTAHAATASRR
jgi:hypothetical protein